MADISCFTKASLAEAFEYLDGLRESGATNMFGAAPYLERDLDLRVDEARSALSAWMKTFDGEKSPDERAAAAMRANR